MTTEDRIILNACLLAGLCIVVVVAAILIIAWL